MAQEYVNLPQFGGDSTVGSIQVEWPFTNGHIAGLSRLGTGEQIAAGTATGLSVASVATATATVTLPTAFPTSCDYVVATVSSAVGSAVLGPISITGKSATGFTINLPVTTAGSGTVSVDWVAFGH